MNRLHPLVVAALLLSSLALAAPDAQKFLQDADQARGGNLPGIEWEIRLHSHDGERQDEPQHLIVRAVDDASRAETLEPARFKGTTLLQVGRNMWLSRPGLSKPIPISPRQRLSGQAANGDIAATNYAGDYEAHLEGSSTLDGETCHLLELTARHKRTTYERIRYWISVKRGVGVKAEFYSLSGKLLKTAYFDYQHSIEHLGRRLPFVSRMVIRDALIDAETVMEFDAVKVRKIAAEEFQLGQQQ